MFTMFFVLRFVTNNMAFRYIQQENNAVPFF